MIYWHIQMNQPDGRGGDKIDSKQMLLEDPPVIGSGEWDSIQSDYFTGENDQGLKIGDIILVREGMSPIALCSIESDCFKNDKLTEKYIHVNYRKVKIIDWYKGNFAFPVVEGTLSRLKNKTTQSWIFIDKWLNNNKLINSMNKLIGLLEYKKQIILQGPPGTGKTRMAKQLAKLIISRNAVPEITQKDLMRFISKGQDIYTPTDYNTFRVLNNDGKTVRVKPNGAANEYNVPYSDISNCIKNRGFEQPVAISNKSGIGSYIVGIAKYLNEKLTAENYKIIQFHPSYSYEDFVRGISAKVNAEGKVYYQVENKILAQFAEKAIANPDANFVLIIDEINRANLPSVLGELIYALEYRYDNSNPDETTVESMYSFNTEGVEGETSNKLRLPVNLYIIGTMNTADRSVGHIDYAIRRRFAFVNVLPELIPELTIKGKELFLKVAELFCKKFMENQLIQEASDYLAPDFSPMDVMPGHSYFLTPQKESEKLGISDDEILKSRLVYEIKPILLEYLKDGILLESARDKINMLNV
ncbi:AAA family ATPase [Candidatus Nomurabacteria bacterium]|nr:AAA family ATPase [Candidatus Nomurabacteria bacterium]